MSGARVTAALIQRARQREDRAIGILVAEWEPDLLKLARRGLRREARSRVDPSDVLQEVWLRFFGGVLARLGTDMPERVHGYVRTMVHHEAAARNRKAARQKRSAGQTQSLHDLQPAAAASLVERRPSPAEEMLSRDACTRFVWSFQLEVAATLVWLDYGCAPAECAQAAQVSLRTWQRTMHAVRERTACWLARASFPAVP